MPPLPTHPKIAVSFVGSNTYKLASNVLNVVFKPGAFGGQVRNAVTCEATHEGGVFIGIFPLTRTSAHRSLLPRSVSQVMSAGLNAAIQSTRPELTPVSCNSAFLGPSLLGKDLYFTSELVRESGRTFVTKRVTVRQLDEGEDMTALPHKPIVFEQTTAFYRPPLQDYSDESSALISPLHAAFPAPSSEEDFADSESLGELMGRIQAGEVERGAVYQMALGMTVKLAEKDMETTVRVPKRPCPERGYGKSTYYVGVPKSLALNTKTVLPYISDGMTQVLACNDVLDPHLSSWPAKLTVWNYSMMFECNASEDRALPYLDGDGKRWFTIEYTVSGARDGFGTGSTRIMDVGGPLLSTATFSYLLLK